MKWLLGVVVVGIAFAVWMGSTRKIHSVVHVDGGAYARAVAMTRSSPYRLR